MGDCKYCTDCKSCESKNVEATLSITKNLMTGKYTKKKYSYKCMDCGHEWYEEYKHPFAD